MILLGEVALGGAGCGFQPLYGSGSTTASGARLAETMASVDVQPIPGRVGQKVRSELIFENTGGGYVAETRYKLKIGLRQSVIDQLVQITGDTREQGLVLEATFKLISAADGQVIYEGSAVSRQRIFDTDSSRCIAHGGGRHGLFTSTRKILVKPSIDIFNQWQHARLHLGE